MTRIHQALLALACHCSAGNAIKVFDPQNIPYDPQKIAMQIAVKLCCAARARRPLSFQMLGTRHSEFSDNELPLVIAAGSVVGWQEFFPGLC